MAILNILIGFCGTFILWVIFSLVIVETHKKEVEDEKRNQKGG